MALCKSLLAEHGKFQMVLHASEKEGSRSPREPRDGVVPFAWSLSTLCPRNDLGKRQLPEANMSFLTLRRDAMSRTFGV